MNNNQNNGNMFNNNMMSNNINNNNNIFNKSYIKSNYDNMNNFNNINNNNMNMINFSNTNPNTYKLMQNFMQMMNPTFNTNNIINANNMMSNFMFANPLFYLLFMNLLQNSQNIKNKNRENINILESTSEKIKKASKKGGILPRNKDNNNLNESIDYFPGNINNRIVLMFITGTGMKVPMNVPINVSLENIFLAFINRMKLDKSVLGKFIYFLNNGHKISIHEKKSISNYGLNNGDVIMVVDTSNLLGGKK